MTVPSRAYVVTHAGDHVECLLEQTGPRSWQAIPVQDVAADELETAHVDLLPPGHQVSFLLMHPEGAET